MPRRPWPTNDAQRRRGRVPAGRIGDMRVPFVADVAAYACALHDVIAAIRRRVETAS